MCLDLIAQTDVLQQRAESAYLGPKHRIADLLSEAFPLVCDDVIVVNSSSGTSNFSAHLLMVNAPWAIPKGRGFLDGSYCEDRCHLIAPCNSPFVESNNLHNLHSLHRLFTFAA